MRRTYLALVCLGLLAVPAAAQPAPSAAAQSRLITAPDLPAFPGHPEASARAALARLGERLGALSPATTFELDTVKPAARGHVVRFRQLHQGVPVLDAVVTVRLDQAGRVKRVLSSLVPLREIDTKPRITGRAALDVARQNVPVVVPVQPSGTARLVVVPADGGRLAWEIGVAPVVPTSAWEVLVDASTGEVLSKRDRARHAGEASVFAGGQAAFDARGPDGSMSAESLTTVALSSLTSTAPGAPLISSVVEAYNCCPTKDCDGTSPPRRVSGSFPVAPGMNVPYSMPMCEERQRAVADDDGNFKYVPAKEPNGFGTPLGAACDGDEFAEVMAYHYAQSMLDYMRGLDPAFELGADARPLRVTANFLLPDMSEANNLDWADIMNGGSVNIQKLMRFDNAMYLPKASAQQIGIPGFTRDKDSVMLFQGTRVDFAYDPDVISHEVGHGIVAYTAGLTDFSADAQGILDAPGAMNEGFADYWAAVRAGDPKIGEYVGDLVGQGEGSLRDLENGFSCPSIIINEVHQDSQHFSAALWAARKQVATTDAGRLDFDKAVLAAMYVLTPNATFDEAAAVIAGEVEDAFDAQARTDVEAAFVARKVTGCERVVDLTAAKAVEGIYLAPRDNARGWRPFAPGPLQFRLSPPRGTTKMTLTVQGGAGGGFGGMPGTGGGSSNPNLRALLKEGSPVSFTYGATVQSDATLNADFKSAGDLGEAVIEFDGGCGDSTFFLALGNTGTGQWSLEELSVQYKTDAAAYEACSQSDADAGTDLPDAGPDDGSGGDEPRDENCGGCASASPLGLALLGGLALRRRRDRS